MSKTLTSSGLSSGSSISTAMVGSPGVGDGVLENKAIAIVEVFKEATGSSVETNPEDLLGALPEDLDLEVFLSSEETEEGPYSGSLSAESAEDGDSDRKDSPEVHEEQA